MAGAKLNPSWTHVKDALIDLKDQVDTVMKDGEDAKGKLSDANLKLAEQTLNEIDAVIAMIGPCPQGLSPYRK
jgi:hypothetical protein